VFGWRCPGIMTTLDRLPRPPSPGPRIDLRGTQVLRELVETYLSTGEPVGSRTLSRRLPVAMSPATIRNVMADLEESGLLYAPHTSAGRLPTEQGLRLFVDGLLQYGEPTEDERVAIEAACAAAGTSIGGAMERAGTLLSGLSQAAGLVVAPNADRPVRHIEFIALGPGRALVVLVAADGQVENRVIEVPAGVPPAALMQAANYLNARLPGQTLDEARITVAAEIATHRTELDSLAQSVVEAGLATWSGTPGEGTLIVRGQAKLLDDVATMERLGAIRALFERLEAKETTARLLELAREGRGVRIFIGSESGLFGVSGCSLVVAPFGAGSNKVVGAIGVIGPTRINYGRIVPIVDYTARVMGRLLG